jgi:hypothetical protein
MGMGLVPEFFIVLGIFVFLAMSFLSALLDDDLPSILRYLFQGAAAAGLGLLVMNQTFINGGILSRAPSDPTRFWISVVYLSSAVSIVAGLNVYLAIVRRKMALSSILSGAVTVPTFMISAIVVSSFLGTGGELSFSPATIFILAVSAFAISLSIFGFLGEARKHIRNSSGGLGSLPTGPVSMPVSIPVSVTPMQGDDDWEESRKKESE